jgi:electron transfer flavoprotein beta subunit
MVGELLGGLLGIPSVGYCGKLELNGNAATCTRFIDGGEETVKVELPLVVSAVKELGEPRIPNMRGIMQARTKPIEVIADSENSLPAEVRYESPKGKAGCVYIDAAEAGKLIDILHNERKLF